MFTVQMDICSPGSINIVGSSRGIDALKLGR